MTDKDAGGEVPVSPGRDLAREGLDGLPRAPRLLGLAGSSEPRQAGGKGCLCPLLCIHFAL